MGILAIVVGIIIAAVWYTNRMRLPTVVPLAVRNERRREDELHRKERESLILESLPVIKYSRWLQWSSRKARRANDIETGMIEARPETNQEPSSGNEKVVIGQSTVNQPGSSDNPAALPQEINSHEEDKRDKTIDTSKDTSLTCSVCTEDFAENDNVRILPCRHIYHRRCIDPWLVRFGGNCPLW